MQKSMVEQPSEERFFRIRHAGEAGDCVTISVSAYVARGNIELITAQSSVNCSLQKSLETLSFYSPYINHLHFMSCVRWPACKRLYFTVSRGTVTHTKLIMKIATSFSGFFSSCRLLEERGPADGPWANLANRLMIQTERSFSNDVIKCQNPKQKSHESFYPLQAWGNLNLNLFTTH